MSKFCVLFFIVNSSMIRIERIENKNRKGDKDA